MILFCFPVKIKSNASLTQRSAAALYRVPQSTLSTRCAKTPAQRNTCHNLSKLTKSKEESVVRRIRDLSLRRFAPSFSKVRSMADQLLAAQHGNPVSINWVERFIKRQPDIKSQLTRPQDYRRILCSNPAIIKPWFKLVASVKAKYRILDEDTYNFNKTGFQIGVGGSVKVVTASEIQLNPIRRQPGDRE
jgi:hypothetical protein